MLRSRPRGARVAAPAALIAVSLVAAAPAQGQLPGSSVTFSVSHYAPRINQSGPLDTVAVDPADDRHIAVASQNGGLFESRDGGGTWTHEDGISPTVLRSVAFIPQRGGGTALLVTAVEDFEGGNGGGGAYMRAPGSSAWQKMAGIFPAAGCPDFPGAHEIAVAPDTGVAYVATDCGLAAGTPSSGFRALAVAGPADSRVVSVAALGGGHLIAGGPGMGVWFSRDDGRTWSPERTGIGTLAAVQGLHALVADPRGGDRAYAINSATDLFETTDGGATWRGIPAQRGGGVCGGISNVRASVFDAALHLYFGNDCSTFTVSVPVDREPAAAVTSSGAWSQLDVDHADTRDLAFRPTGAHPYLLTSDGGIHGATSDTRFRFIGGPARGLDAHLVYEVTGQYVGSRARPDLYFGTQHNGLGSARDLSTDLSGQTGGEGFGYGLARRVAVGARNRISFTFCTPCSNVLATPHFASLPVFPDAPRNNGSPVYLRSRRYVEVVRNVAGAPAGLALTDDEGGAWRTLARFARSLVDLPRVAGPASDPTLVQAYDAGLDASGSFSRVLLAMVGNFSAGGRPRRVGFPAMQGFGGLGVTPTDFPWKEVFAVDPEDPGRIIAPDVLTGRMMRTVNGGRSWVEIPDLAAQVTHDGAYRFSTPMGSLVEPDVSNISFCPDNPARVLLGTRQGGVFLSWDGGATWREATGSERMTYVTSFFWLDGCNTAFVSTYGRGMWRLDMRITASFDPRRICRLDCTIWRDVQRDLERLRTRTSLRGIIVADGRVLAVRRRAGRTTIRVTPGSAILFYRSRPPGVRIRYAARRTQARRITRAVMFAGKRPVIRLVAKRQYEAVPLARHGRTKGRRGPVGALRAQIIVRAPGGIGNDPATVVPAGRAVVVHARLRRPTTGELQLRVDGQPVATARGDDLDLSWSDKRGFADQGVHVIDVVRIFADRPEVLAAATVQVSPADDRDDEAPPG